ncbi:ABC transporter permease [Parasphingorhabdus cellanae]|uniref:Transport permease protein n=1 Tax=Parasphingorhabdus cellanae TaxID=2806553 RepID=A0ABX7T373_9SPHN|nr:ABC transporter permease [Parasphingorhabdus cellanae]QTD56020.1 ABC transporter permease [Parasphingorhabdus cellanae]
MLDQPQNSDSDQPEFIAQTYAEPGVAVIRGVNWGGFLALYWKEVRRFFKVQLQTVWAPSITTLLFLVIFTVALGRGDRTVLGVPFADFIAPGLICMGMIQNAFANSSFALLVGKIQGTIVDYLMPPLSVGELLAGLVAASITRAALVGFAVWLAMALWPGVNVSVNHWWAVIWFGFMGSAMLALLGVLTSIWAEKFDHAAAVTNFVVAPAALLSGTFYSIDRLAPAFQAASHANPFFYAISGFRYGFLGEADSPVIIGSLVLLGINVGLTALCYFLLKKGWKIKS